jgi:signal transduction histidine kinase
VNWLNSLRSRFLLIVIGGVLLPLAILGLWLNRATERSGESLLRDRLNNTLSQIVNQSGATWVTIRGELLDLADDPAVHNVLSGESSTGVVFLRTKVPLLEAYSAASSSEEIRITVSSTRSNGHWRIAGFADSALRVEPVSADSAVVNNRQLVVTIPVYSGRTAESIGTIRAELPAGILIPLGAAGTGGIGAVLGITDTETGVSLASLPFDPELLERREFSLGGERWIVERRSLQEPRVRFAAAAPLTPYAGPFRETARRGGIALVLVALSALALATLLTRRLTSSLERVATAAESVSRGDLDQHVEPGSTNEVVRVATAFNSMTESLRRTLTQLAQRERLAAVGEFAGSLAHEIRNPLTSIRINLQQVEERIGDHPELRIPLERALGEISRLDRTVSGALRLARSASVAPEPIYLRGPLEKAMHASEPAFAQAQATLEPLPASVDDVKVRCDAGALEGVFLNLLLNAAQCLEPGGRAMVTVNSGVSEAEVSVIDNGRGIPSSMIDKIFDPFFTTKPEGTGLGLSVARQVVTAHNGSITSEPNPDGGTIFRVRLPLSGTVIETTSRKPGRT